MLPHRVKILNASYKLVCLCRLVATPTSERSSSVFSVVYALSPEQMPSASFATVHKGVCCAGHRLWLSVVTP